MSLRRLGRREIVMLHYDKNRQPLCDLIRFGFDLHHCNADDVLKCSPYVSKCVHLREDGFRNLP